MSWDGGTATYDGMALAQSIIEYIHDRTGAKTLFATHYHELTALSETLSRLENVHVATLERDGQVTFLHKIEPGPADKSYGDSRGQRSLVCQKNY